MRQPKAGRPVMPGDYGIAKGAEGLLPWTHVEERLSSSRNYWVSTTRPDGRPHDLAEQPAVAVHLEHGDDVVIVEGVASRVMDAPLLAASGLR